MWQRLGITPSGDVVDAFSADNATLAVDAIVSHPDVGPHLLFMAVDVTSMSSCELDSLVIAALNAHCVFACTWGPGCERLHDLIDEHDVMRNLDATPKRPIVMTSWHDQESLSQAIECAVTCNQPASDWGVKCVPCRFLLIGSVLSPDEFVAAISKVIDAGSNADLPERPASECQDGG